MATEAEAAQAKADKAAMDLQDAQAKADDATKTPEQLAVEKAAQKADDLAAQAAFVATKDSVPVPTSVVDAGTLVIASADAMAGDHLAQKFGNDPANPKLADGVDTENKVMLSRKTPDVQGLVYCEVPKEMAGDYMRAGWNAV